MGLLDLLLGQSNPISQYVDSNPATVSSIGAGLAAGPSFSQGLSNAAQLVAQNKSQDRALQLATQQRNATADWLQQIGHPELANPVRAGSITGADAFNQIYKQTVVAPGSTIYQDGKPLYTGSPTDVTQMTMQQRQQMAPQYGLTQGTPQFANFVLAGKLPDTAPPAGYSFGALGADGQPTLKPISGGPADTTSGIAGLPSVGVGSDGRADPDQQAAFLSSLDPSTASLVKSIGEYRADLSKVTSLRGDQRQKVAALVQQAYPGFDMSMYGARANMQKALAPGGTIAGNLTSVNTTIQHLAQLSKDADALGNQSFPAWNAISNTFKSGTGSSAPSNFDQAATAVADEAAKVFKGGTASDQETIRSWRQSLNKDMSPEQIKGAINQLATELLPARLNTLQQQYAATMGGQTLPGFLTKESVDALKSLGVDPAILDPRAGDTGAGAPAAGASTQAPVTVQTPEQAAALPPGTVFKTPDGRLKVRP